MQQFERDIDMGSKPKGAAPRSAACETSRAATRPKDAAAVSGLVGIALRDEIEGMIAAEMIAAHNAVMECYRRARVDDDRRRLEELRGAARLSCAFVLLVKALHRYRDAAARRDAVFGRPIRHCAGGDQTVPAAGHENRGARSLEKNRGITPCSPAGACARPERRTSSPTLGERRGLIASFRQAAAYWMAGLKRAMTATRSHSTWRA